MLVLRMRYTAGRDYRYAVGLIYDDVPWPEDVTAKQRPAEAAAFRAEE